MSQTKDLEITASPYFVLVQDHELHLPHTRLTTHIPTIRTIYPDEVRYVFEDDDVEPSWESEMDTGDRAAEADEDTIILIDVDKTGNIHQVKSLNPRWQVFDYQSDHTSSNSHELTHSTPPSPRKTHYRRVIIDGCVSGFTNESDADPGYKTLDELNDLINLFNDRSAKLKMMLKQ
ncbi:hypothetical protein BABINDRAFT_159636 [Babjeviella inositovora NRRL Y-12698]|uniref:Uncharacterized protein n=1 Tax=Babjeviella inositovora NRRL Y-12698 TaxID=984486 RepID=A0A1E3QZW9_9ASCO|nr:uncharacterized protein BABINDRAFT_159636 [Babjeviella inositovora NRRL Y-12698]ODQ83196.1 hypothetical protein BABINDRAFT_159636 [Babjeviella inositovora NRRL Y-12698]